MTMIQEKQEEGEGEQEEMEKTKRKLRSSDNDGRDDGERGNTGNYKKRQNKGKYCRKL